MKTTKVALTLFLVIAILTAAAAVPATAMAAPDGAVIPQRGVAYLPEIGVPAAAGVVIPQQGVAYLPFRSVRYGDPVAETTLQRIVTLGADWIGVSVPLFQTSIGSTEVFRTDDTPSDHELQQVITTARDAGLRVMLKLHLYLTDDPAHWHGQIGEAYTTNRDWQKWFNSYGQQVNYYARLAAAAGVDQFCIGTELGGTVRQEQMWRRLVRTARQSYGGLITYAANHGEEVTIDWWDAVDVIGVDAYYPLTQDANASVADLVAGWAPHILKLSELSNRFGKAIIFTEVGYASQDGSATQPWVWNADGKGVDLEEQKAAYQALSEAVAGQPWFGGSYIWAVHTTLFQGGPLDNGFSPIGKPAEYVLANWYDGTVVDVSPVSPSVPESPENNTLIAYQNELSEGWHDVSWDAEVDFAGQDAPYEGTAAIHANMGAWGAVSLWHEPFDTTGYSHIAFYVRVKSDNAPLWVYFYSEEDVELGRQLINDAQYVSGGAIAADEWTRVNVPLADLNADGQSILSITLQEASGAGAVVDIDLIQLVNVL